MSDNELPMDEGGYVRIGSEEYRVVAVRDEKATIERDDSAPSIKEILDEECHPVIENVQRSPSGAIRADLTTKKDVSTIKLPGQASERVRDELGYVLTASMILGSETLRVWFRRT